MTDQLRQAAQQALEALDSGNPYHQQLAAKVLRTALEQQDEPVAREGFEKWAKFAAPYMDISRFGAGYSDCNTDYAWAGWQAAQRQWVGLTDEEMSDTVADIDVDFGDLLWKVVCLTKIIEAQLKEKNGY